MKQGLVCNNVGAVAVEVAFEALDEVFERRRLHQTIHKTQRAADKALHATTNLVEPQEDP